MNSISITHKEDLVTLPLSNSDKTVVLNSIDFDALIAKGFSPQWRLSQAGKVMVGNNKTVARIILDAGKGLRVSFANDRIDVRMDPVVEPMNRLRRQQGALRL